LNLNHKFYLDSVTITGMNSILYFGLVFRYLPKMVDGINDDSDYLLAKDQLQQALKHAEGIL
jgi:hypothetical protein